MISFSNTIEIGRAPSDVYSYLADLEHTPEWNWAINRASKVDSGPVVVGSRFVQMRSAPRAATEVLEISDLQPAKRIEVAGDLASIPARLAYELEPTEFGTRLTNRVELDPGGPLGLVAGLFTDRVRASVAANLRVLKAVLEARTTPVGISA